MIYIECVLNNGGSFENPNDVGDSIVEITSIGPLAENISFALFCSSFALHDSEQALFLILLPKSSNNILKKS